MRPRFEDVFTGKQIIYAIHRDSVLARDPGKFVETFDVARISAAGKLRELRASVHLSISGWDEDPRALHEIPQVREFVQELDRAYPHLMYAVSTKTDVLRMMSLCLVPTSVTQRLESDPEAFRATYDNREYHQVLERWFKHFDALCVQARAFTVREHAQMTIELAQFFGLEWFFKQ